MDWSSGKTLLRQALDWNSGKTLLKQMTNRIKFWGGNNATLDYALQKEKETQNLASRFAATKTEAMSSILHWSKGEQNKLFSQIFGRVAELNWMWEKALEDFSNQYSKYHHRLEMLFETDKRIDEHNKELMDCHARLTKAKKQYEAALKKGDKVRIGARENEFKTMSLQYFSMQTSVEALVEKLELKMVTYVRAALKEQANAYVNLAGKCQAIFTAQRGMTAIIPAIIPQNNDASSLSNHDIFNDNIHSLVDSLSKKLGLLPPHEGGIDQPDASGTIPSSVDDSKKNTLTMNPRRMAKIKHTGNIGLPVPPRSAESLEISSYGSIYMPPQRKKVLKWNSNTSVGYATVSDPTLYESVEDLQQKMKLRDLQVRESWTDDLMMNCASTEACSVMHYSSGNIQMRPRSYSNSHLPCTSVCGEGEEPLQSFSLPKRKTSEFSSLPIIPNNLPSIETHKLSIKNRHHSSSEDLVKADQYPYHKGYLTLMEATMEHPTPSVYKSHSLDAASFVSLHDRPLTPPRSKSCEAISNISFKQVQSNVGRNATTISGSDELSIFHPNDDHIVEQHKILPSTEEGQLNIFAALNQVVYHFVANSLRAENDEYSGASLREIFEQHCHNEKPFKVSSSSKGNEELSKHDQEEEFYYSSNDSVLVDDSPAHQNYVPSNQKQED
ncbi:uncharacterized protein [Dysidea avara]|uniref:uncharacterized protein isoform X2 n=1 Tax=Dysidea avara TaxID=196820 RepID=UPI00332B7A6D